MRVRSRILHKSSWLFTWKITIRIRLFDRLGNNAEEIEISGVGIPRIRIPVKTGRNISVVIEAAAMNYRAKEMGFDATRLFEERLTNLIAQNEEVPHA